MSPYYNRRTTSISAAVWSWIVYAMGAFALGGGLTYCTIQVLETAAKVAG